MDEGTENDIRINVDVLATEIEYMINSTNLSMSSKCCIFRVPNILSRHNPKAYEPNAFSVGPFHHGKPHLEPTQKIKLNYLRGLISRFRSPETMLRNLTAAISQVQKAARDCYAGPIDMDMKELVKVLLLDGCFLIELFRKFDRQDLRDKDDPIYSMSCLFQHLYHDLILLENQIPWLVLDCLFYMTATEKDRCSLSEMAIAFLRGSFCKILPSDLSEVLLNAVTSKKHQSKHILDLLRNSILMYSDVQEYGISEHWLRVPSTTTLKEAGVMFETGKSKSILDIRFKDGVLEIPSMYIQETTESLFRNLISFEQCLPNCSGIITCYAILLDNLINTEKDLEILCKREVMYSWLNIEDGTKFFNQLYDDVYLKEYYYRKVCYDVNKFCRRRGPRYRRVLMRDYCKHPCAIVSIVAAVILLLLTFLQTLFTIIK